MGRPAIAAGSSLPKSSCASLSPLDVTPLRLRASASPMKFSLRCIRIHSCILKTKQEKKCLGHFNKSQALGVLVQVRSTPCGAPTPCLSTLSSTRRLTISRYGKPHLKAGFTLRCFQRLSLPGAATRLHGWRHDRYTVGPSTPVLSYWGQTPSSFQRPRWIWTELSHDVLNPAHVPL